MRAYVYVKVISKLPTYLHVCIVCIKDALMMKMLNRHVVASQLVEATTDTLELKCCSFSLKRRNYDFFLQKVLFPRGPCLVFENIFAEKIGEFGEK
jgi:hypothetical protein